MKTINATEDGFNAVKEEMRAVRVILMQHRTTEDRNSAVHISARHHIMYITPESKKRRVINNKLNKAK
ncbi:hypothetical protein NDU88_006728 [Pleurodeles waltl]|uniref:Uncharacterized protein n=1 Tax=Pleurodeles waltl TaxID=8319 RepID=A0AAV7TZ53_PLEWA|nr:hypothetical protein NDU88_006728 [Pleurodeles waltl]